MLISKEVETEYFEELEEEEFEKIDRDKMINRKVKLNKKERRFDGVMVK